MKQEFQCPAPKEALVDLRDVKLDSHMEQAERIRSFLRQIKDPHCFRGGRDSERLLCGHAVDPVIIYHLGAAGLSECAVIR